MLQSTKDGLRELIVVGDRVLIKPDQPEERTEVGLYLPQTVVEKEKVQAGRIVSVGPGLPIPDPGGDEDEVWRTTQRKDRYLPLQAREGDFALFLKKSSVEIKFEGEEYLVVPQAAILLLLRDLEKKKD
jgi:co-chaperonin GroES (HSP10)